ncbi:two-component system sensor histidine kinase PhoQ [Povalibacter uvarum]|uniref:histidine kinase n=1 Tax=Povalibacter uvarum TaxID=732238 RepID=A0A841HHY5_9GAMM|nr:ATP-binding protein [Povalibacter uvarum]MBB6092184.1 two-component system sensor histidine kinase PhoQ [Povalibacter uvarum]
MQPHSLSTRLLASVSVLLVVFFGITIVALDLVFRDLAERSVRDRLEIQLLALITASDEDTNGGLQPAPQLAEIRFNNPGSGLYGEIVRSDGYRSWRSPSLAGTGLDFAPALKTGERRFGELRSADGTVVLALSRGIEWEFNNRKKRSFVYSVAESRDPYYAQLNRFRVQLFGWFSVLMLLLLGGLAILLRRLLAPLRRVEREIEAIEVGEMTELGGGYPRELLGITTNLNTLLRSERDRLQRYRNTLGNLAHSFKTPLAVMRNLLGASEASKLTIARQLDEQVGRMDDIVKYQLKRAAASGGTGLGTAPVDVRAALEALRGALLKVYMDRGIVCDLSVAEGCMYFGDREDLSEMAGNLLDNAFKWAKSRVRLTANRLASPAARRDGLQLIVEDDGPGIPEAERARVLDRGARLDERVSGQGIGLSVVREVAKLNGGTLHIGESALGGALIEIRLPPI